MTGTAPSEPLIWTFPGLTRTPLRTATLVALVPLTAIAGLAFTRQPIFVLLGPAFLAPVLSRYFLKPSYRLTSESARASWGTAQTEIKWSDVRHVIWTDKQLRLSPVKEGDFRGATRGVELVLPSDEETRSRVLQTIRERLPEQIAFDPASQ